MYLHIFFPRPTILQLDTYSCLYNLSWIFSFCWCNPGLRNNTAELLPWGTLNENTYTNMGKKRKKKVTTADISNLVCMARFSWTFSILAKKPSIIIVFQYCCLVVAFIRENGRGYDMWSFGGSNWEKYNPFRTFFLREEHPENSMLPRCRASAPEGRLFIQDIAENPHNRNRRIVLHW